MLAAEDDGAGPFSFLKEPVHFGLADSAGWAGGVGFWVFGEDLVVVGAILVRAMFPDVSGHVVEAEFIGGEGFNGGGAGEAVFAGVVVREFSGEDVGEPFAVGLGVGSPDEVEAVFSSAGGEFPFGFGGEALASPFAVGVCIFPSDADDGVVFFPYKVGAFSGGSFPRGPFFKAPPLPNGAFAFELHGGGWAGEDEGSRF